VLIAGNWKMYKGPSETAEFCVELRRRLADLEGVDVAVCPPFASLAVAVQVLAGTDIAVAAQNVHWEAEGAYTGEVSPQMLLELGVYGAIVGHSERRQLFGETDESAALRIEGALDAGLHVIACVGETEDEREAGETESVVRRQVDAIRTVVEDENLERLAVAYEPVWAIGTGRNATPEQASEAHAHIRGRLRQWFGADAADRCHVIYGGSVKPDNIASLAGPDIDGALVGGASLDVRSFATIVANFRRAKQ
jgi:triosephosphate isomerase (TIM)